MPNGHYPKGITEHYGGSKSHRLFNGELGDGVRGLHLTSRRQHWWTNWYVQNFEDECEWNQKGARCLQGYLDPVPLHKICEDGYPSTWSETRDKKFLQFRKPRPPDVKMVSIRPSEREADKHYQEDNGKYPLDHYHDDNLVWKDASWRTLRSSEKAVILGYPRDYLKIAGITEDQREETIAQSASLYALSRILESMPNADGIWPPMRLQIQEDRLEGISRENEAEPEESARGAAEAAPAGPQQEDTFYPIFLGAEGISIRQLAIARKVALDITTDRQIGIIGDTDRMEISG